MEYQDHLFKNVFHGDKERFEKAWQQALDEGCEGAVSWKTLIIPTPLPQKPMDLIGILRFEGLAYQLQGMTFLPFPSFFLEKR